MIRLLIASSLLVFSSCDLLKPTPSPSVLPSSTPSAEPTEVKPSPVTSVTPSPVISEVISPTPAPKKLPIAVWHQPASSLQKWKDRGINTLMGPELEGKSTPLTRYIAEAQRLGFDMYMTAEGNYTPNGVPSPSPIPQIGYDPVTKLPAGVVGFQQPDEPDMSNHNTPGAIFQAGYETWKAKAPNLPVFCSFSGSDITNNASKMHLVYDKWSPYCDVMSEDWYLISRNADRYFPPNHKATALKLLQATYPGKQYWSIVEASDQKINCPAELRTDSKPREGRAPTADEFRAEVWSAVIHGATGIAYFPQEIGTNCALGKFGGFRFDAMTPDLIAEMIKVNAMITKNAEILLSPGKKLDAPVPFLVAERTYLGKVYRLVLNYSNAQATYSGKTYGPYEVSLEPVN
jgi:hypothetical protein